MVVARLRKFVLTPVVFHDGGEFAAVEKLLQRAAFFAASALRPVKVNPA